MQAKNYLQFLAEQAHTVVMATLDEGGRPVTCAVDLMDWEADGLIFLTARGKNFYRRLKANPHIALTALQGRDTLSSTAVSLQGLAREEGPRRLPGLFLKNPYMERIYPDEDSRRSLTVFQIYEGRGEWFDLSRRPIERASFSFGGAAAGEEGYAVTSRCTGCGQCLSVCPQGSIDLGRVPAVIRQEHCLHCGNCMKICPQKAVIRRAAK